MVFFVLSGFYVGGSALRSRLRFDWLGYAINHLSRLWTVLIPALIFTFAVDLAIRQLAPETLLGVHYTEWNSGPSQGDHASGLPVFIGNLLFLQTILVPVHGTNSPLWSLANEFWYYTLFPLLQAVAVPRIRPASLLHGSAAVALLLALPRGMVAEGLIWGLGVAVYGLRDCPVLQNDMIVGLAFTPLGLQITRGNLPVIPVLEAPVRQLSEISYSLYLFHFPLVVLLGGVILAGRRQQPTPLTLLGYLSALAIILALSALAWWAFERHTPRIRRASVALLARRFRPRGC